MVFKKRFGAVLIICALAGGMAAAPVEPVLAQGLLERLFAPQRYDYRDRKQELWQRERSRRSNVRRKQRSTRSIRVKSAQYYTYRPDALKTGNNGNLPG